MNPFTKIAKPSAVHVYLAFNGIHLLMAALDAGTTVCWSPPDQPDTEILAFRDEDRDYVPVVPFLRAWFKNWAEIQREFGHSFELPMAPMIRVCAALDAGRLVTSEELLDLSKVITNCRSVFRTLDSRRVLIAINRVLENDR